MLHPSDKINAKDLIQPLVHDIKNRKEKKNEIARDLMWAQPTIRYFHLIRLTKSSYQKAEKKIVKRKKEKN